MSDSKRFEDWEKVDCNECARYYDSSCDGVKKGSAKPCNGYLATRKIVIPNRLNSLEKRICWLEWITGIGFILLGILTLVRLI